jgi:formylmethanofuran dehydrogenase subunit C
MKELRLKPKNIPAIKIEAETISPNKFAGRGIRSIEELIAYAGNKAHPLKKFFNIDGEIAEKPSEQTIILEGDASRVKYIGSEMTAGRVLIEGDAGMHVGAKMKGGEILIKGSAADWAGAEMEGGLLQIMGDVGHQLGAAYRGNRIGMAGGCIFVRKNAGFEAGASLRRGMIVIKGDVGPFLGVNMHGGEIFVFGKAGKRIGAMARGNGGFIACFGGVDSILPSYIYEATYRPPFMRLYLKQMEEKLGLNDARIFVDSLFDRYRGDIAVGGDAEILVAC